LFRLLLFTKKVHRINKNSPHHSGPPGVTYSNYFCIRSKNTTGNIQLTQDYPVYIRFTLSSRNSKLSRKESHLRCIQGLHCNKHIFMDVTSNDASRKKSRFRSCLPTCAIIQLRLAYYLFSQKF
jgi:hypothetical protein